MKERGNGWWTNAVFFGRRLRQQLRLDVVLIVLVSLAVLFVLGAGFAWLFL